MSIYPDVVYRRVRRLEAWHAGQPNVAADLLLTLIQAQAETRRLLPPERVEYSTRISRDTSARSVSVTLPIRGLRADAA